MSVDKIGKAIEDLQARGDELLTDGISGDELISRLRNGFDEFIDRLRAAGASDEQIASSFRTAAKNLAAETVAIMERRKRKKLSDKEVADISDKFNAIYSDFYSAKLQ